jgi:hypothetical protein
VLENCWLPSRRLNVWLPAVWLTTTETRLLSGLRNVALVTVPVEPYAVLPRRAPGYTNLANGAIR